MSDNLAERLRKGRADMPVLTFKEACEQRDRSLAGHTVSPGLSIGGNKHHGCMDEPGIKPDASKNDRAYAEPSSSQSDAKHDENARACKEER